MPACDRPVVLAVDDDPEIRATYEYWLDDEWDVRTAGDGETALASLDGAVDVVLLDRRMPGLSGRELLDVIRERAVDPRVVMVTAMDPDADIVELPFDAYLTKPVDRPTLTETVQRMLDRREYDEQLREYFALVEKRATLRSRHPDEALTDDERYTALERRIETIEEQLDAEAPEFGGDEFVAYLDEVA